MWKNIHKVSAAGIRIRDLLNTSLFPKPQDRGFPLIVLTFAQSKLVVMIILRLHIVTRSIQNEED